MTRAQVAYISMSHNEAQNERLRDGRSIAAKVIVVAAIVAVWTVLAVLFSGGTQ